MEKGHSRRRQTAKKKKTAAIVLLGIAVILLAFLLRKGGTGEEETTTAVPETESTVPVPETETGIPETETIAPTEPVTEETTPAPEWVYYRDKSGAEERYLLEEDAAMREYEWGIPRTDENGNAVFRITDDSFPEYEMLRGVDISQAQGAIDWYKVREARCDFVLICADEMFADHYDGAYRLGLKIGAYYPSAAENAEEARAEAAEFLSVIGERKLDLFAAYVPEAMDTDELPDNRDKEQATETAAAFCEEIETAGLRPAIYASMRYEAEMYDMTALAGKYDFWYSGFEGTPETPYPFAAWQYCLTGGIKGINGPVNLDVYLGRPYEETAAEEKIFSYTQFSPEAYETTTWVNYRSANVPWNGDWAKIPAGGQEFMAFGCGICCLSNAVSTLTESVVDPEEMYYSTKKNTSYYPESGRGAVSWDIMKAMAGHYGLSMSLCRKPGDYAAFQKDVAAADNVIILVNGDNDRRLWWYTDGHYVGIWEYDPDMDTVFVTDPSTHFNRLRVPLTDIYHALKTGSNYQYAVVSGDGSD